MQGHHQRSFLRLVQSTTATRAQRESSYHPRAGSSSCLFLPFYLLFFSPLLSPSDRNHKPLQLCDLDPLASLIIFTQLKAGSRISYLPYTCVCSRNTTSLMSIPSLVFLQVQSSLYFLSFSRLSPVPPSASIRLSSPDDSPQMGGNCSTLNSEDPLRVASYELRADAWPGHRIARPFLIPFVPFLYLIHLLLSLPSSFLSTPP